MSNSIRSGVSCYNDKREQPIKMFSDAKQQYNSITMGAGSYIVDVRLEFGGIIMPHVLIGNYTSIAHQIVFLAGYNHDHRRAYTYPFDDWLQNEGKANTYTEANRYQIIIGHDVWIGRGVTVLGGVYIGNGAVIGANAVVTRDIPPYAIAVGNPARVVDFRFPLDVIEKMQQIKWWYWRRAQLNERLSLMKDPKQFVERFYEERYRIPTLPISAQLHQLRNTGKRIFFLAADIGVPNAVFEHVFDRYLQTYDKADNTLLIIADISGETEIPPELQKLKAIHTAKDNPPDILWLNVNIPLLLNILQNVEAVITTREDISSFCVDFASDHDAKIFSGLDEKVFLPDRVKARISFELKTPMLTIGIPTYNRLKYLKKSLAALSAAVGNDPRVEILVCNNDSSDRTEEFVLAAKRQCSNLVYRKNPENIGSDNIYKIYEHARGKFVLAAGDDDNFNVDAIKKLLDILSEDDRSSIILMKAAEGDFQISEGNGTVEYLRMVSYWTTFISGIVFRKSAFDEINTDQYNESHLKQVYFQLAVLKNHPHFRILSGNIFRSDSGQHQPHGYNFAQVFIKEYLDILEAHAGLPREDMTREKARLFNEMIAPWVNKICNFGVKLSLEDLPKIFEQYYKNEPYYPQATAVLKQLKALP